MSRPTIADVAKAAGVSITTVSHALTGQGRINEETRQRIHETADRLGYRPNMMARGLRTARTRLLAVANTVPAEVADGPSNLAYYMTIAGAVARTALRSGYATILIPPDAEPGIFSEIAIDGAVLLDPQANDPFLAALRKRHVPFVTIGREPGTSKPGWCVDTDMIGATLQLLDHFAVGGPCRPALILTEEQRSYSTDAHQAYLEWTARYGLTQVVVTASERLAERGGEAAMTMILTEHPDINAVFVPLDSFATGAMQALTTGGVKVPEAMQIATMDGIRAQLGATPLTALHDDLEDYARSAIGLLLHQLDHPDSIVQSVTLNPRIVVRASTMAAAD